MVFDNSLVCIFIRLSLTIFYDHGAYYVALGKC